MSKLASICRCSMDMLSSVEPHIIISSPELLFMRDVKSEKVQHKVFPQVPCHDGFTEKF